MQMPHSVFAIKQQPVVHWLAQELTLDTFSLLQGACNAQGMAVAVLRMLVRGSACK